MLFGNRLPYRASLQHLVALFLAIVLLLPHSAQAQSGSRGSVGGSRGGGGSVRGGGGAGRPGGISRSFRSRQRQFSNGSTTAGNAQRGGFAIVELFTSQGCSSCPAADENLARIAEVAAAKKLDVYTLSYHVDYWNQLGWEDPYSTAWATERQESYAKLFESKRIYTPQMIVNGQTPFVGSNRQDANTALNSALQLVPQAQIQLEPEFSSEELSVAWSVQGSAQGNLISIALVQNKASDLVDAGENRGRELKHVNIVRQLQTKSLQENKAVEFSLPDDFDARDFHLIGFIQSSQTGAITSATRSVLDDR